MKSSFQEEEDIFKYQKIVDFRVISRRVCLRASTQNQQGNNDGSYRDQQEDRRS